MKKVTAVGYTRVSTLEQAERGLSLSAQEDAIRAYASLHSLDMRSTLKDAGESAKDLHRPGARRLLAMIRARAIGAVVVWRLDRLTRSPRDLYTLVDDLFLPNNIELISVTESLDTRTPAGRAMLGMMAVFSAMERELIGERTRLALRAKLERGERLGVAPYGFRIPYPGAKHLEPIPEEIVIAKRILGWRKSGKTFGWIARRLNIEGVPSKKGGRWSDVTTRDVWLKRQRIEHVIGEVAR